MNYSLAQESRIGGREVNQDRAIALAFGDAVLLAVADGMGGHLRGEVAAQIAIDTLGDLFRAACTDASPRLPDIGAFLATALRQAHAAIVGYAAACRMEAHAAPRTTCIACVVQDGQACWAHAGDSRLYLIHGASEQGGQRAARSLHTRDHSIVQRMLDEGQITAEEAERHPLRHRVFSCLGGDTTPHIDVSRPVRLADGDVIALCSDGAWSPLGESLVASLGQGRGPLATTVPRLLDSAEANAGVGADNLTLVALRWEGAADTLDAPTQPSFCDTYIGEAPLTDIEIERAIAELRSRMNPSPPKQG